MYFTTSWEKIWFISTRWGILVMIKLCLWFGHSVWNFWKMSSIQRYSVQAYDMRASCRAPSNNDRSGFRSQINDTSAVNIMLEVSSWAIYHWQILRWRQVDHSHSWQPLIQWGEIHADTQKRTANHASGYSANFHNMLTCALCAREQCDSHVLCLLHGFQMRRICGVPIG